ncbi:hypothetical protein C6P45_004734 [Maudiozyma exigua]|uniref:Uncharacterized protein n=1 Tax=Maudiozyma exigua TaxID=34358 RepID=A0A9P6WF17_MAUEX|nr:hypothetical protein C6P45_004734 [Kazachstania exigua]
MVFDKFYFHFVAKIASTIAVLISSYKLRVPPYTGIAAIVVYLLVILFTDDGPGNCYRNDIMREYSPLTGKLEPSFWSWRCSRNLISEMMDDFIILTIIMNLIIYARRQKQEEKAKLLDPQVTGKV